MTREFIVHADVGTVWGACKVLDPDPGSIRHPSDGARTWVDTRRGHYSLTRSRGAECSSITSPPVVYAGGLLWIELAGISSFTIHTCRP